MWPGDQIGHSRGWSNVDWLFWHFVYAAFLTKKLDWHLCVSYSWDLVAVKRLRLNDQRDQNTASLQA